MGDLWRTVFFAGEGAWIMACRLLVAAILGSAIGINRGRIGRAADLRTHVLVSIGACMTTLIGVYSIEILNFGGDPLRVGAQVVSGIGFLGVGTIIARRDYQVMGLTTAAGLWATAMVGLAAGLGFGLGAALATAVIIFTMSVCAKIESHFIIRDRAVMYLEVSDVACVQPFLDLLYDKEIDVAITTPRTGLKGHAGLEVVFHHAARTEVLKELSELEKKFCVIRKLETKDRREMQG